MRNRRRVPRSEGTPDRIYLRRPSGFLSAYSITMLYGAAILAPKKYRREYPQVLIKLRGRLWRVPRILVRAARVFNTYVPGEPAHRLGIR